MRRIIAATVTAAIITLGVAAPSEACCRLRVADAPVKVASIKWV